MSERRPIRLAHYPCGCKKLAPMEVSTVEFEMHLPKCDAYRQGGRETLGNYEAWSQFYDKHFAGQTPEVDE